MKNFNCILCGTSTTHFYNKKGLHYYQCNGCSSILLHPDHYLSPEMEKRRYLEHNNNVNDPGYQQFVAPIVNEVIKNHSPGEKGLDYGSGTGPVISKLLKDQDHNIITYDPIFEKKLGILDKTYDYIVCCEVIEHFHNPVEEFQGLRRILKPGGKLYCMTYLFSEDIDFKTWNYKDDQTHVIIYHANAIKWMNNNFGFREYTINGRLIIFHG